MADISPFSHQFREAMAHLCAAVSIVTSNGRAGKVGITVSSVCSVTDTPPTLLFCVNQNSPLHDIIQQNGKVCINVLNPQHEELAKHFAGMLDSTMAERFKWDIWQESDNRQPVLKQAVSALQGEIIDCRTIGTHSVFFVELTDIQVKTDDALVYFARQFKPLPL